MRAIDDVLPWDEWPSGPATAGQTVAEALRGLERRGSGPRAAALPTGFDLLDSVLDGGVRAQDLVLLGGQPGVGKTIAALQWARNMALSGAAVVYACFEHDETALLSRLLLQEIGLLSRPEDVGRGETLRRTVLAVANGATTLRSARLEEPSLQLACEAMSAYADRLRLVRVSSARTGVDELAELVARSGARVLVVDYLQKVAVPGSPASAADQVQRIAEDMKELALTHDVAVVAVVASADRGLGGGRLRLHHLRGASALSYEADVAILLNEKLRAVSKVHLAYDGVRASTYRQQVVFTVEKNRGGPAPIDVEFTKDFANYRFVTRGAFVSERLIDERDEDKSA